MSVLKEIVHEKKIYMIILVRKNIPHNYWSSEFFLINWMCYIMPVIKSGYLQDQVLLWFLVAVQYLN